MTLLEFSKYFPNELSCRTHFRQKREQEGISCKKCGVVAHYWKSDKECWECKTCGRRISLTSGTMVHRTKLPLMYWYFTIHLLTATKKSFSTLKIQRQLGHKFYEPIWLMVHKIRASMGKRDARYLLGGELEIDEGFFTTFTLEDDIKIDKNKSEPSDIKPNDEAEKDKSNKRGRGSERKTTVLVLVESTKVEQNKKGRPERKVGYLKMVVIPNAKMDTLNEAVGQRVESNADVITDGHKGYGALESEVGSVKQFVAKGADSCKTFPWVHICIANAKRWFLGINHAICTEYVQNYLNEFVYNFNRRYMGSVLFDRLLIAGISEVNTFKPKFR